jgi:coenzyme F420-reducing hydrogenase beta subunit
MMNIPRVIDIVVKNDLCTGCGLCVYKCPSQAIEIQWNEEGFLVPELAGGCDLHGECLSLCPFNPFPEEKVKTENEIAALLLKDSKNYHPKIGKYEGIYAGFANEFRLTSSSGGIATYVLARLLDKGVVNHIFAVQESTKPGTFYEYAVLHDKEELINASKTKYYPVTLVAVMPKIHELEGKVAIVGVACFIKAIRLAQHAEPELKEKIPFLVGIICGGMKNRFFTEYLANKAGVEIENIEKPQFRIKDFNSTAGDYSFGCIDRKTQTEKNIKMRSVGDMWGTGLFKANACDFCDDVTTELADISLGDAWLEPFNKDGKGANVIVTRSELADEIIQEGMKNDELAVEPLSLERFLSSQQGSFNHRHKGLGYRIELAKKQGKMVPSKRHDKEKVPIDFKWVQKQRLKVREKSLEIWRETKNASVFDSEMKKDLQRLYLLTKIYHYKRKFGNKF